MATQKFFDERTEQSEVKARIVQKYFDAWANVILANAEKIAYVDLYAGPGRYKDGAASTPLLVLQNAITKPKIAKALVSLFNDADENNSSTLEREIQSLTGVETLQYQPVVRNLEVDESAEDYFSNTQFIPTFSFIDPFGYKGLSLKIIKGVIKDWGSDCVFFFNYSRINAGISNPVVNKNVNALFGEQRANALRERLPGLSPELREALILEALADEIKSLGGKFVLPFTFRNERGTRTTHKLIFVSKNFKGYSIMKDIMAKESSTDDEGVPSFKYSPADASMPLLFSLNKPISALKGELLSTFAGETLSLEEIYERHSVDTPFVTKNYKDALSALEVENKISVDKPRHKRPKRNGEVTFAVHHKITFPAGKQGDG